MWVCVYIYTYVHVCVHAHIYTHTVAPILDFILAFIWSLFFGIFMWNLYENESIFLSLSHRAYNACVLSYFQEKSSGFDRTEHIKSDFKED